MPNWCSNWARFSGPNDLITKDSITQLKNRLHKTWILESNAWWPSLKESPYTTEEVDEAKDAGRLCDYGKLFFARLLEYEDLGATCKVENYGYNESVAHIGTKWDPTYDINSDADEFITVYLQSAWSPPERGLLIVARKYGLDLVVEYEEGGCDFAGMLKYDAKTDSVRTASMRYLAYRFLESDDYEVPDCPEALHTEVARFIFDEWDLTEADSLSNDAVKDILDEIRGIRDIGDLLCDPIPASEWVKGKLEEGTRVMASIQEYVTQMVKTADADT